MKNINNKLDRINTLIGYLIFTGILSIKGIQKEIAEKINANKVSVSRALSGESEYFTDSFIERVNTAFGSPFNLNWLLTGDGDMGISFIQTNEANNNINSIIHQKNDFNCMDKILEIQKGFQEILSKKEEQIGSLIEIIKNAK